MQAGSGPPASPPASSSSSCRRCRTALEAADLRCSICALAVPAAPASAAAGDRAGRPSATILRCRECAAAVSYSAEARAPHCAFCGAVMDIEHPVDPIEAAELLVPFAVDRASARRALGAWLRSRGWFRPRDLSSAAAVESIKPLHWSAWSFDADARVSWAADSDTDAGRSAWAPHAGSTTFQWRGILVPATRGLSPAETSRLSPGYALAEARPLAADSSAGGALTGDSSSIEAFDVQRSAARRRIVEEVEAIAATQIQKGGHIPGSRFRNVHTSVLLSGLVTRRYVLPAWVMAYRYGGEVYRTIVHGQDPSIVVGDAPLSWAKIVFVTALTLAVVAIIAALVAN